MDRLLPRIQLVFAVTFAAVALCGPMLFAQAHLVLLTAVVIGIILGVMTVLIGWRLVFQAGPVVYPFAGWSASLLKPFLTPKQAHGLRAARGEFSPAARKVFGIFSLSVGVLLVIALLVVAFLVLGG